MVFNRASRHDYDAWEELGNAGWGWDSLLFVFPFISSSERNTDRFGKTILQNFGNIPTASRGNLERDLHPSRHFLPWHIWPHRSFLQQRLQLIPCLLARNLELPWGRDEQVPECRKQRWTLDVHWLGEHPQRNSLVFSRLLQESREPSVELAHLDKGVRSRDSSDEGG